MAEPSNIVLIGRNVVPEILLGGERLNFKMRNYRTCLLPLICEQTGKIVDSDVFRQASMGDDSD